MRQLPMLLVHALISTSIDLMHCISDPMWLLPVGIKLGPSMTAYMKENAMHSTLLLTPLQGPCSC